MAADSGRDDFIIAIRSAFLKKGTRQNFITNFINNFNISFITRVF